MGRIMPSYCEHDRVFDWGDFGGDDPIELCPDCETRWNAHTSIVITPPQGAVQILVCVPHAYEKDQIQVDYRQKGGVWTPEGFWTDTVEVNVG